MNINEALIALGEGKIIKCDKVDSWTRIIYYKIIDNNIYSFIEEKNGEDSSKDWELFEITLSNLRYSSISETDPVEEYKKKKLKKNYGALGFNKEIISFNQFFSQYEYQKSESDKALKFINALKTLIELKSHPLAVPFNDGKTYQYFICSYAFEPTLTINNYSYKLYEVSPAFNNKEDAQQAIKDIGKDRLLSMFKVLQGIYD